MPLKLFQQERTWYWIFAILLLPALFVNLGAHHIFVHTDESRRALVALEMIISKQYLAPTLNGEWYYEKPPLFNWLIVASFKLLGSYSAFAVRLPMVLSVMLFTWVVYRMLRGVLGKQEAALTALATTTTGRIILYDSFLGLIDVWFSVLIFVNFLLFYHLGRQQRYWAMYLITYAVTAAAYLTKGLPSLVFQFFTILAFALYAKKWKLPFHPANFLGVLVFLLPVGIYYWLYTGVNPGSFATVMEYTWFQSSQRTPIEYGFWETVLGLLTFPLEQLYHFAPWTVLVLALFSKKTLGKLWQDDFLRYATMVIALNLWVYWISPGVHPRYLFMFVPLCMAVLIRAFMLSSAAMRRTLELVFMIAMGLMVAATVVGYYYITPVNINYFGYKWLVALMGLVFLFLLYAKIPQRRLLILACFLLVVRIGYNWLLLPNRDSKGRAQSDACEEVLRIVGDAPLYVLSPSYCHDATTFMISRTRGELLRIVDEMEPDAYYILYEGNYDPSQHEAFLQFGTGGTQYDLLLTKLLPQPLEETVN